MVQKICLKSNGLNGKLYIKYRQYPEQEFNYFSGYLSFTMDCPAVGGGEFVPLD
jgi:hypothetical protein